MSGIQDMRLFEGYPTLRPVVFVVWSYEPNTTNRKWVSVHATEESAADYVEALNKLCAKDGIFHGVEQEWLIGAA
jgi:hypothetical protein